MSNKYKENDRIPTEVLCARLRELVRAITTRDSGEALLREFTMSIPVELDRDADCVLSECAKRLTTLEAQIAELEEESRLLTGALEMQNAKVAEQTNEIRAYELTLENRDKQLTALRIASREASIKGERMAMALSDAQHGYVCEYRQTWTSANEALQALLQEQST